MFKKKYLTRRLRHENIDVEKIYIEDDYIRYQDIEVVFVGVPHLCTPAEARQNLTKFCNWVKTNPKPITNGVMFQDLYTQYKNYCYGSNLAYNLETGCLCDLDNYVFKTVWKISDYSGNEPESFYFDTEEEAKNFSKTWGLSDPYKLQI